MAGTWQMTGREQEREGQRRVTGLGYFQGAV